MQIIRHKLSPALLGCLFLLISTYSWGQEIGIEYVSGKEKETMYLVDIKLQIQLDDQILNALQHGVTLDIDVELQIRRERKWLWDKLLKKARIRYQLEYYPLSDDYLVLGMTVQSPQQFQTLTEALKYISSIKDYPIVETEEILADKTYLGYAKAELNIEKLPPPLQPITYTSSKLRLESSWYEWNIR